ncbi:MAG: hypothetical protein KJO85_04430, partial [Gammaproteobacteria bacterium]|nr:hypothetical protein [Gammaproteobacteria bacterium]
MRTLLWTALTLLILLAAIMVGIGKLLMPYSQRYQPQLEEWLSREFQQPVVVGSFTGEWKAFGPRISFEGVTLMGDGSGEGELAIQRAALDVKPLNLILPGRPLYSFHIIGADLSLVRSQDGRFELSGLGVSGRNSGDRDGSGLGNLARVGELRLEDSSLGFEDQEKGIEVQLTGIRGRLQMNGAELATELEADISDRLRSRVLGDLKATLLITLGDDQRLSSASWHVKTGELMIEELARQLPQYSMVPRSGWLNAEIWGDWSRGESQVMQGVLDVRESLLSEQPEPLRIDHLNTRFRWNFLNRKSWRVDLSDLVIDQAGARWQTERLSLERNIPGNLGLWVSSDFLELEFPMQLTSRITSSFNTRWPRTMPRQARGRVQGFDLVLDSSWKMYLLKGQLKGVDAWQWGEGRYPDVAGIDGTMDLQGGEGQVEFNGSGIRLDWPRNFRNHAIVDIPACTMEINWGASWALDTQDCLLNHEHFSLSGRARFAKSDNKPVMDVNVLFQRTNLAALDDYWPSSVMGEKVIDWLSRGIVEGSASSGRYSMRGDLDDFPFRGNEGILLAQANIDGASLEYAQGWPAASGMQLETRFRNTSMLATGSVASMAGAPVSEARAYIEDFKNAVLELDFRSESGLPALLEFIGQTPLLEDTELDLSQFQFEGDAVARGKLFAPLGSSPGTLSVDGELELSGNRFTELRSDLVISDLNGVVSFDRQGMSADGLSGVLRGHPSRIGLAADWDADEVFSATVDGRFPVGDILPASLLESEPMLNRIEGDSDWNMHLVVARPDDGSERQTWLE